MPLSKTWRVLDMYKRLTEDKFIDRDDTARRFGVDTRTLQRDIADIRTFIEKTSADNYFFDTVTYDRKTKSYRLLRGAVIKPKDG